MLTEVTPGLPRAKISIFWLNRESQGCTTDREHWDLCLSSRGEEDDGGAKKYRDCHAQGRVGKLSVLAYGY